MITFTYKQTHMMTTGSIPETLRRLRREHGINKTQMGRILGVTHVTVRRYESGETELSLARARQYADYFGISLEELSGRQTDSVHILNEEKEQFKRRKEHAVNVLLSVDRTRIAQDEAEPFIQRLREAIQSIDKEGSIEDAEEV